VNRPTDTASIGEWALYYALLGQPVFPVYEIGPDGRCSCGKNDCAHPGKHPRTNHGYLDATTENGQIRELWTRWPNANIGGPTGSNGLWDVLDVDGAQGDVNRTGFRGDSSDWVSGGLGRL
jgi:hypothetical protein